MEVVPVVIDRISFGDRPHVTLSVGDEIRFWLEFVPAAAATVPADLHVALDGTVETVAVLQLRDEQTGLSEVRLRVTAGAIVATWTAYASAGSTG
ncbi:MAG TPA: hypothetical protein VGX23_29680 [Actinocrinis sp.]|nr:hypothetical protein [Actinocrinis sp.]